MDYNQKGQRKFVFENFQMKIIFAFGDLCAEKIMTSNINVIILIVN